MPFILETYQSGKKIISCASPASSVISIGRSTSNDIVLGPSSDDSISRYHAAIIPLDRTTWAVQDLGSKNGIAVNGVRAGFWNLVPGDTITIGNYELSITESETEQASSITIVNDLQDPSTSSKTRISAVPIPDDRELAGIAAYPESMSVLYKLMRAISIEQDFAVACRIAIHHLTKLLQFDRGIAVRLLPDSRVERVIARIPDTPDTNVSKTVLIAAVRERKPLLIEDISIEARFRNRGNPSESIISSGAVAAICIPFSVNGKVAAALYFDSKESRSYSAADRSLIKFIGRDLSSLLERQLAYEHMCEQMRTQQALESMRTMIVGISAQVRKTLIDIPMYARTGIPLIISGESGTGKELIARAIHYSSERCNGPLIEINCAAIPESLLESELFGVIPDYPGFNCKTGLPGKFRLADGGTLFLDEIGDMSPALQAKLLRCLDDHSIWPLGSTEPVEIDVRIIAATNRDMQMRIKDGAFRLDLYQRLNVAELRFPPLRERREDIPLLAGYFLCQFRKKYGAVARCNPEAIEYLCGLDWPGNVRELRNTIERAFIRAIGSGAKELTYDSFQSSPVANTVPCASEPQTLDDVEKEHIRRVLAYAEGNKERAHKILGISRATLFNKIKVYGLDL